MTWVDQLLPIKHKLELYHANAFSYPYILRTLNLQSFNNFIHLQVNTTDALQYWPSA